MWIRNGFFYKLGPLYGKYKGLRDERVTVGWFDNPVLTGHRRVGFNWEGYFNTATVGFPTGWHLTSTNFNMLTLCFPSIVISTQTHTHPVAGWQKINGKPEAWLPHRNMFYPVCLTPTRTIWQQFLNVKMYSPHVEKKWRAFFLCGKEFSNLVWFMALCSHWKAMGFACNPYWWSLRGSWWSERPLGGTLTPGSKPFYRSLS